MSSNIATDYQMEVIQAGDNVSEILKNACIWANNRYSLLQEQDLSRWSNILLSKLPLETKEFKLESQTDWVGTKVRIYMRQFNLMYERFTKEKVSIEAHMSTTSALDDWNGMGESPWQYIQRLQDEFQETANELMYRMMLDLYAMIVDDFRLWHVAVSVTDIIDINHIKIDGNDSNKEQWIVFANAMKFAMESVIQETKIALIAGETAILGKWDNEKAQASIAQDALSRLRKIEELVSWVKPYWATRDVVNRIKADIQSLVNPDWKKSVSELGAFSSIVEGRVELNIGWSGNGILKWEKLVEMKAWDVVLAFEEKKTEKGILSPRANGISAIRRLENILWDNWTDQTLTDFFDHPSIARKAWAKALQEKFLAGWLDMQTKIWDVVTGRTTVFNPFISRHLLGGFYWPVWFEVSWMAHMTGNPPRKGAELIGNKRLSMLIDYSEVEIPQIIEMCMLAEDLSFEKWITMWNMGIPMKIIVRGDKVQHIIDFAQRAWFTLRKVGEIREVAKWEKPTITIKHHDTVIRHSVEELLMKAE